MTAPRFLGTILLALSLGACGFHLRGSYAIPPELQRLNVSAPGNSALSQPLRDALKTAGISLDSGSYTLTLTTEKLTKQTSNTDGRAKVAEYTLLYDVRYRISRPDDAEPAPEQKLSLRRSYQYDTTAIVGKSEEEETLIRELYADAAQQILRRLSFFKPAPTPSSP
ncbi:LPS-assembly lipoprotein [Fluviicoccus keumensis]|uniref:LPS-assembly lipoprotein LptE n=1 Tax=Fluviicoccus keumensis TaxID=1435465 RepID=A0A4Q7YJS7_9GAMM|nr:LPS assembly lipoprotein LptE [Fluviicoccus keumensis]RZU37053.1 LPS-assembly lipoprotein [Fluviicoccus keumensis]